MLPFEGYLCGKCRYIKKAQDGQRVRRLFVLFALPYVASLCEWSRFVKPGVVFKLHSRMVVIVVEKLGFLPHQSYAL